MHVSHSDFCLSPLAVRACLAVSQSVPAAPSEPSSSISSYCCSVCNFHIHCLSSKYHACCSSKHTAQPARAVPAALSGPQLLSCTALTGEALQPTISVPCFGSLISSMLALHSSVFGRPAFCPLLSNFPFVALCCYIEWPAYGILLGCMVRAPSRRPGHGTVTMTRGSGVCPPRLAGPESEARQVAVQRAAGDDRRLHSGLLSDPRGLKPV